MEKKAKMSSENAKPTPEEVAFNVMQRWFDLERVFDFESDENAKVESVDCGIVNVCVYKTYAGLLFELWPYGQPSIKYRQRIDGLYHLSFRMENHTELPEDFKSWFIDTIDRMYGWN